VRCAANNNRFTLVAVLVIVVICYTFSTLYARPLSDLRPLDPDPLTGGWKDESLQGASGQRPAAAAPPTYYVSEAIPKEDSSPKKDSPPMSLEEQHRLAEEKAQKEKEKQEREKQERERKKEVGFSPDDEELG
jgi:hypothetical protein